MHCIKSLVIAIVAVVSAVCVPALNCVPQESPMAGTWTGTLTAEVVEATSETGPADLDNPDFPPVTIQNDVEISFDANGVPDKLIVYRLNTYSEGRPAEIPAVLPGDSTKISLPPSTTTFTVREADYIRSGARVVVDMTYSYIYSHFTLEGYFTRTSTGTGPQTIQIDWSVDGPHLTWNQQLDATVESTLESKGSFENQPTIRKEWIAQRVTVTGLLTRKNNP